MRIRAEKYDGFTNLMTTESLETLMDILDANRRPESELKIRYFNVTEPDRCLIAEGQAQGICREWKFYADSPSRIGLTELDFQYLFGHLHSRNFCDREDACKRLEDYIESFRKED